MKPVPGLSVEQQTDAILQRMVLWGESRGETNFTKLCVLWVIKNRTVRHNSTMRHEILKPKAFSCFNHDDPNLGKLLIGYSLEPLAWEACGAIVDLFTFTKDPTSGADHYYRVDMDPPPKWGRGHGDWKERLVTGQMAFGSCP